MGASDGYCCESIGRGLRKSAIVCVGRSRLSSKLIQMIDEPIHLESHKPIWQHYFNQEQKRIQNTLQIELNAIQHIGSTAIFGIDAKPVIDIMIGLQSFPPSQHLSEQLMYLGYEALGEASVSDRLYFRYRNSQRFNLHIVEQNGRHWKCNLAFRDYLRAFPEEAKRYEVAKKEAIQSGATSLLAYSEAKSAVIAKLMSQALLWQVEHRTGRAE